MRLLITRPIERMFTECVIFLILDLYLVETSRDGEYAPGFVLFASQTNSVNVRFTSDYSETRSGFSLNVRSINCRMSKFSYFYRPLREASEGYIFTGICLSNSGGGGADGGGGGGGGGGGMWAARLQHLPPPGPGHNTSLPPSP